MQYLSVSLTQPLGQSLNTPYLTVKNTTWSKVYENDFWYIFVVTMFLV